MFKLRNPFRSFLVGLTAIQAHVRDVVESNARLENENTALRRELATAKEERNALGRDLYALSRGEAVETMAGEAVEQRLEALTSEIEAMRPVFAATSFGVDIPTLLMQLKGRDLSAWPYSNALKVIISHFEAYRAARRKPTDEACEAKPEPAPMQDVIGVYDTGKDKWTHGQRDANGRRYLGPCPSCGSRTVSYGDDGWKCTNGPGLAGNCLKAMRPMHLSDPPWWCSDIVLKTEEGLWAAFRMNKPHTKVGLADSPAQAVDKLQRAEKAEMPPMPLADLS